MENARVLVVDDSRTERFWEEKTLIGMGCEVVCAEDGTQALRMLMQDGDIDLVLLDLTMPRMNGHEFLVEMSRNHELRHTKVLVLSGKEESEVIPTLDVGANDYWLKGSGTSVLKHKIRNLLYTVELEKKLRAISSIMAI